MLNTTNFDSQSSEHPCTCTCDPDALQPFGECLCNNNLTRPFRLSQFCTKQFGNVDPMPYTKAVTKNGNSRLEITLAKAKEDLATVRYKIANLQPYFSREQIRVWKRHRRLLIDKINDLEAHISLIIKSR